MSDIPNVSRADGNAFIEALNARSLCACTVRRQLVQLGTPGPYLPCDLHTPLRCGYCTDVSVAWIDWETTGRPKGAPVCRACLDARYVPNNFGRFPVVRDWNGETYGDPCMHPGQFARATSWVGNAPTLHCMTCDRDVSESQL